MLLVEVTCTYKLVKHKHPNKLAFVECHVCINEAHSNITSPHWLTNEQIMCEIMENAWMGLLKMANDLLDFGMAFLQRN
jgi:hypothetical protein